MPCAYATSNRWCQHGIPLKNPKDHRWENEAFSYYRHGISLRTNRYRFTKYFRKQQPVLELYDHKKDPYENNNIVATHPKVVEKLEKIWEKGNTGLYEK